MSETFPSTNRGPLVDQFVQELTAAHQERGRTYVLPNFTDSLDHNGRIPLDTSRYRRMNGVYFSPETQEAWGGDPYAPETVEFEPRPFRGHGREQSRRKVFFGDLRVTSPDEDVVIPVAVKPFAPQAFHYATQELGMLGHIRNEGIATLQVIGMLAVPNGVEPPLAYVITREEPITTLDNTNWQSMSEEERWAALHPAVELAAELHSHVIMHGDFETRNVPVREGRKSPMAVDTERSVSLRDGVTPYRELPRETRLLADSVSADFAALSKSVKDSICQPGSTPLQLFEGMLEHVYEPYQERLEHIDSPYQAALLDASKLVIKDKHTSALKDC